eukprot:GGOE01004345.1.p1 GENE.GGOE01004345.1~~GGOE01004345.1.p1  ORF type:complete len:1236 (+),score=131.73 GGOE01004345.1:69-3776(+)
MPKHRTSIPFARPPPLGSPRKARSEKEDAPDVRPFKSYYRYLFAELHFLDPSGQRDARNPVAQLQRATKSGQQTTIPAKHPNKPKVRRSKATTDRSLQGPGELRLALPSPPPRIDPTHRGDRRAHTIPSQPANNGKALATVVSHELAETKRCNDEDIQFALALVPPLVQPAPSSGMMAVVDTLLPTQLDAVTDLPVPSESHTTLQQAFQMAQALAGLEVATLQARPVAASFLSAPCSSWLLVGLWAAEALWPTHAPLLARSMAIVSATVLSTSQEFGGSLCSAQGGHWLLQFGSNDAAVDCALALQLALLLQPWADELETVDATTTVHVPGDTTPLFRGLRVRSAILRSPNMVELRQMLLLVPGGSVVVGFAESEVRPCVTKIPAVWAHLGSTPSHLLYVAHPAVLQARFEMWKRPLPVLHFDPSPIPHRCSIPLTSGVLAMKEMLSSHLLTQGAEGSPPPLIGCFVLVQALGSQELWATDPTTAQVSLALFHKCSRSLLLEAETMVLTADVDQLLVFFSSAHEAVAFALRLQINLLRQPWPNPLLKHPCGIPVMEDGTVVFRGLRCRIAIDGTERKELSHMLGIAREGQTVTTREVQQLAASACEVAILLAESGPCCLYPVSLLARHASLTRCPPIHPTALPTLPPKSPIAVVYAHIPFVAMGQDRAITGMATKTCQAVLAYVLHICGGSAIRVTQHDLLAAFPTAAQAVAWGIIVQEALLEVEWPEELHRLSGASSRPLLPGGAEKGEALLGRPKWLWRGLRVAVGIHTRCHHGGVWSKADPMDVADPLVQEALQLGSRAGAGCCVISDDALHLAHHDGMDGAGLVWVKRVGRILSWPSQPTIHCILPWALRSRIAEQCPVVPLISDGGDGSLEFAEEAAAPDTDGDSPDRTVVEAWNLVHALNRGSAAALSDSEVHDGGGTCTTSPDPTAHLHTKDLPISGASLATPLQWSPPSSINNEAADHDAMENNPVCSRTERPPREAPPAFPVVGRQNLQLPQADSSVFSHPTPPPHEPPQRSESADLRECTSFDATAVSTLPRTAVESGSPALWVRKRRSTQSGLQEPEVEFSATGCHGIDGQISTLWVDRLAEALTAEAEGCGQLGGQEASAWQAIGLGLLELGSQSLIDSSSQRQASISFVTAETAARSSILDEETTCWAMLVQLVYRSHHSRHPFAGVPGVHPFYAKLQRLRQGYRGRAVSGPCPFRNPSDCPFPHDNAVHGFAPLADELLWC